MRQQKTENVFLEIILHAKQLAVQRAPQTQNKKTIPSYLDRLDDFLLKNATKLNYMSARLGHTKLLCCS